MAQKTQLELQRPLALARVGDQISVLFHREAISDLTYLAGMVNAHVVEYSNPGTDLLVVGIFLGGSWDFDDNRRILLIVGSEWDLEWFADRMGHALESCDLIPQAQRLSRETIRELRSRWLEELMEKLTDPDYDGRIPENWGRHLEEIEAGRPTQFVQIYFEILCSTAQNIGIYPADLTQKVMLKFFKKLP